MKQINTNLVNWAVVCVREYAKFKGLCLREAFRYLYALGGIAFLQEHYDIEHTLSLDDTVEALETVCRNEGGHFDTDTKRGCSMSKQDALTEAATQDIIGFIMVDNDIELDAAMDLFYNSIIFDKLHDRESGLYLEGSAYVYEFFKEEQNGAPFS